MMVDLTSSESHSCLTCVAIQWQPHTPLPLTHSTKNNWCLSDLPLTPTWLQPGRPIKADGWHTVKHGSVDSLEKKASSISFLFKEGTYACTKRAVVFIYYQNHIPVQLFYLTGFMLALIIVLRLLLLFWMGIVTWTWAHKWVVCMCVCLFSHVNLQGRISYVSVSDSELWSNLPHTGDC